MMKNKGKSFAELLAYKIKAFELSINERIIGILHLNNIIIPRVENNNNKKTR